MFFLLWFDILRFLSPITVVPVVSLVGLGLFMRGFPLVSSLNEMKNIGWWKWWIDYNDGFFMFYKACQLCGDRAAYADSANNLSGNLPPSECQVNPMKNHSIWRSQILMFAAVFEESSSRGPPCTWEVWLARLRWYHLGFCCYPHCFRCLQQCEAAN